MRDRIAEAADAVSLEVMVELRRARGLPAPAADSAADRAEFEAGVRDFLERLRDELAAELAPDARRPVAAAGARGGDARDRALAAHVALARALPDYWQRFQAVRGAWAAERLASGGERRGLRRRLFGR